MAGGDYTQIDAKSEAVSAANSYSDTIEDIQDSAGDAKTLGDMVGHQFDLMIADTKYTLEKQVTTGYAKKTKDAAKEVQP